MKKVEIIVRVNLEDGSSHAQVTYVTLHPDDTESQALTAIMNGYRKSQYELMQILFPYKILKEDTE